MSTYYFFRDQLTIDDSLPDQLAADRVAGQPAPSDGTPEPSSVKHPRSRRDVLCAALATGSIRNQEHKIGDPALRRP